MVHLTSNSWTKLSSSAELTVLYSWRNTQSHLNRGIRSRYASQTLPGLHIPKCKILFAIWYCPTGLPHLYQLPHSSVQAHQKICSPSVPCSDLSHSLLHLQFPLPRANATLSSKLALWKFQTNNMFQSYPSPPSSWIEPHFLTQPMLWSPLLNSTGPTCAAPNILGCTVFH